MRRHVGSFVRIWRTMGLGAAVRAARWRVAGRLGRVLVGGELDALRGGLAEAATARRVLEARLADLTAMLAGVREQAAASGRELGELRRLAGEGEALRMRQADEIAALERRLDQASGELAHGLRATRETVEGLERAAAESRERSARHGRSIVWLAERQTATAVVPPATAELLVSVIMPTWNRAARLRDAVASVQGQRFPCWELLVVDDGGTDETPALLATLAGDARIRVLRQEHAGHARARNRGLAEARGEVIAYLDTDNRWDPGYLDAVVQAFASPDVQSVYLAQLVRDRIHDDAFVRAEPFDAEALRRGNYVDLNVFAHRRALFERLGGFDEALDRLVDWDLILRYTADAAPVMVPAVGGEYALGLPDQVSARESYSLSYHRVRRKLERPIDRPLRVLFALWHYPQLTESYVRVEITTMRRLGVDVAVWSQEPPAAAFDAEVPVFSGALAEAIAQHRPHVVHVHWLDQALAFAPTIAAAGLPLTVRGHGFEFSRDRLAALEADPAVRAIYLFPHFMGHASSPKVRAMSVAFDADRYRPGTVKDPRLVVRAAAGIPTKDLDGFIRIAARCPAHRFVLAVGRAVRWEQFAERLCAVNAEHGNPVDLRVDVQHEDLAALLAEAGIYLHTHTLDAPYGMPMSIAEAMASGAWVLARRCPESIAYVGDAGAGWDTEDEAVARITETLGWDDRRWASARRAAVERAFARWPDSHVLQPMLDDWLRLAGEGAS